MLGLGGELGQLFADDRARIPDPRRQVPVERRQPVEHGHAHLPYLPALIVLEIAKLAAPREIGNQAVKADNLVSREGLPGCARSGGIADCLDHGVSSAWCSLSIRRSR